MAFNQDLVERVHKLLKNNNPTEKKMFGCMGVLIDGKLVCGVHGDNLIVRVGKERYNEIMVLPNVKPFDLTHKTMMGWIEVIPAGTKDEQELMDWIHLGLEYTQTLQAKD